MMRLKANHFTDAQACTIYGFQYDLVFEIVCCSQQASYFFHAKDYGQSFNPRPWGNLKMSFIPFADIPVEADNAREIVIARSPGNITVFKKMTKIILNLVVCQCIWRLAIIFCQPFNSGYIKSFGMM